jgi:hypothetical protein
MIKQILKQYNGGGWQLFIVRVAFVALSMFLMHLWLKINTTGWYVLYLWCTLAAINLLEAIVNLIVNRVKQKYFTKKPTGHRAPAINLAEQMQHYANKNLN